MAVKARITAIKANGESIVERVSATRVHVEASTGETYVEVIARADGRVSIEVKQGHLVMVSMDLLNGVTLAALSNMVILNGKAVAA